MATDPNKTVLVHQYLYYVLAKPIWSDYEYDLFCHKHSIDGGGGSDRASDYPQDIIDEANKLLHPNKA